MRVHGGTGGITAHLEDLERTGALLRTLAAALAASGKQVMSVAVDPALQLTGLVSPLTFGRAEVALGAAAFGPGGLATLATTVEVLGACLGAAAGAYRAADAAVAAGLPTGEVLVGRALAAGVVGPVAPAVVNGAALAVGVITVRLLSGDLNGPGRPLPAGVSRIGGLTLRLLADHARLVEAGLPVLTGLIDGVVAGPAGDPKITAGGFGGYERPSTVADAAARLGQFAGVVGAAAGRGPWLTDSGAARIQLRPQRWSRPAANLEELVGRIPETPTRAPQIHIERVDDSSGAHRWVVSIPGTAAWSPRPGRTPFDLTGDVRLMAGERTAGMTAVVEAMHALGVSKNEPVLLVGHSQGGLIAAALAADPAVRRQFTVTHVLTTGAPIASIRIPDDVQVLSIEHDDDLVPRLDGRANCDRPNWVTVSASAPVETLASANDRSEPLIAHRQELYQQTAARVDRSIDPSITDWRKGVSPFLDRPQVGGAAWNVDVTRAGTS